MCELIKKTRRKEFTGYKIVVINKETKAFYSSFTGQKYRINKLIAKAPKRCTFLTNSGWTNHRFNWEWKNSSFYKKDFDGFTTVFLRKKDLYKDLYDVIHIRQFKNIENLYISVVAKVTITGEIWESQYGAPSNIAFAGNIIKNIKVIKIL